MSVEPARHPRRSARDWAVDALCVLLGVAFTALAYSDAAERNVAPLPAAVEALLGLLASFALWLRRRSPLGVAVVVGVLGLFASGAAGAMLIAVFTLAVHRPLRTGVAVSVGFTVISLLLLPLIRPDLGSEEWPWHLLSLVCVAAILAWGAVIRARRQVARAARERAAAEQEHRVADARQQERTRIAREMHDVLAHRLSLLSLHAGALELWPGAQPAEVARAAGVIRSSAHAALEDLREVIGVLRADGDDPGPDEAPERPQPTLVDLPGLIDESRRAGTGVELDCSVPDLRAVPDAVGRTAFRIVQEGLTNARKHADRTAVSVAVRGAPVDGLEVEVRNPCPTAAAPVAPIPGAGVGIIGLSERAALSGGRLEHGRTPAGDFRLWAWLPWPA